VREATPCYLYKIGRYRRICDKNSTVLMFKAPENHIMEIRAQVRATKDITIYVFLTTKIITWRQKQKLFDKNSLSF
jgi:hypothetical protein